MHPAFRESVDQQLKVYVEAAGDAVWRAGGGLVKLGAADGRQIGRANLHWEVGFDQDRRICGCICEPLQVPQVPRATAAWNQGEAGGQAQGAVLGTARFVRKGGARDVQSNAQQSLRGIQNRSAQITGLHPMPEGMVVGQGSFSNTRQSQLGILGLL